MIKSSCESLEPRRFFAAGDPLDGFGVHGVATVPGSLDGRELVDVQATRDGKLLASIGELYGEPGDFVRFNADGTPDAGFGSGGVVDTFYATTRQIAVRSDGRFYAICTTTDDTVEPAYHGIQGEKNWFLARFLPNGRFDRSFGKRGRVRLQIDRNFSENFESTSNDNRSIHLDSDGRLTMVVYYERKGSSDDIDYAVVRYDATGRFDSTFNRGRPVELRRANDFFDWPALSVTPDGGMLIAANRTFRHQSRTVALRLTPSGAVDTRHTADGLYFVDNVTLEQPRAALAPDGHVYISGADFPAFDIENYVYRLTARGRRDKTFADGRLTLGSASSDIVEVPLVPLKDGGIVVGVNGFPLGMILQRFGADGKTDIDFGKVMVDSIYPQVFNNFLYSLDYGSVVAVSLDGNGTSPFSLSNKKVTFNGTEDKDRIEIGADTNRLFGVEGEFRIKRNFWARLFPEDEITSVVLNAGAGDDEITVALHSGLNTAVVVNAGAGDDTITATGAHITVHGGAGDDTVKGDSSDSDL